MKERIASPVHIPNPSNASDEQNPFLSSADKSVPDSAGDSSSSLLQSNINNAEEELEAELESPPPDLLEKLKASAQQKEFWALEYQLLKMKYDRISRVC